MKKNRMMRLASILLVATLMSTCTISGTFAKYVTTGSSIDSARVAKWGVEISTWAESDPNVSVFKNNYDDTVIAATGATQQKVVAPGTKNEDGITFSITGTPEVDVRLEVTLTNSAKTGAPVDVYLPAGNYTDWTLAPYNTKIDYTEYYPVVYTLKNNKGDKLAEGNLTAIKAYLESDKVSKVYNANTDLKTVLGGDNGVYTLTWAWAFGETTGISGNDKADTLLGNIATGDAKYAVTGASTTIDFAISVTATQVD